jgi:4-hydroxybenzoate polyprenyltransferase
MNLIVAFFRLIRSLNLLFIVLTQYLFQYFIIVPIFRKHGLSLPVNDWEFALLSLSSVLIAAAGYIINDYFDLNIDRINKPQKLVVEKHIKRRWAIIWHWVLSFIGVIIGFFLGWRLHAWWLGLANLGCVAALWFYSTVFKKRLLSGNIIISLLTAWVVMVVGFLSHYIVMNEAERFAGIDRSKILRFTFLYAGFAFIISLIREVVKDIEDMDGDAKYGCNTMPIIWGVRVSKVFAATWMVVLIGALLIVTAYVLQMGWWIPAVYCLLLIIVPLLQLLRRLRVAVTIKEFHYISSLIKVVMFTGILSMIFFRIY